MPATIKGPAIFLAQFASDDAPFNTLPAIARWAADLGYKGIQIPSWDKRFFDLETAATSKAYCDEIIGVCSNLGVEITELSTHMQGQLVSVHPTYDLLFDAIAPERVRGNPKARQAWAVNQLKYAALASRNLGLDTLISFCGALATPFIYPWPQRPEAMIREAFAEQARRWGPILDVFDDQGVSVAFEISPSQDMLDGASFEMFLAHLGGHERCTINYDPSHLLLQQLDYLDFIDIFHERITAFHVKDAEFNPTGRQGFYSGFQRWINRAARFRSLGDGQVDFRTIFSKLTQYGYDSWAVLEWECALKSQKAGAAEAAPFITRHIIEATKIAFDDYIPPTITPSDYKSI